MQKEIHEQPKAIADTAEVLIDDAFQPEIFGENRGSV
jgi:glucosamine--fructose-6-phosphate aminotransferase (isomerizing)